MLAIVGLRDRPQTLAPLSVAHHARAVHCNAMQFSEHKPRQEEGRD